MSSRFLAAAAFFSALGLRVGRVAEAGSSDEFQQVFVPGTTRDVGYRLNIVGLSCIR
jgi:hypothetical protein